MMSRSEVDMVAVETIIVQIQMHPFGETAIKKNMSGIKTNSSLAPQHVLHNHTTSNITFGCSQDDSLEDSVGLLADKTEIACWNRTLRSSADMTPTEVTVLTTVLLIVFCCSLLANTFVFLVFSRRRFSLSISNRFLANLTLCNCLFTVLVMPVAFVSLIRRDWPFGHFLCQCTGLAMNLLVSASIFTLAVISLDRYCAVVTPLHYTMRMTRRRCWAFIVGIWVAAFAVSIPPLLGWNEFRFLVNKMVCTVWWSSPEPANRYYTLFLVSLSFVLPMVAMLWTYSCIFRAARDNSERTRRSSIVPTIQSEADPPTCSGIIVAAQCTPINKRRRSSAVPILRRLSQTSSRSSSLLMRREEWKTAVTSFLILFSFMLCWLPYFVVICIRSAAPWVPIHPVMATISTVAAMFGSACNPMVYVFRSKSARQDLRKILTRKRSFRNESINPGVVRRVGSMRSDRGERGDREGRDKSEGVAAAYEELFAHGECHSIQEEGEAPCCDTSNASRGTSVTGATVTFEHDTSTPLAF